MPGVLYFQGLSLCNLGRGCARGRCCLTVLGPRATTLHSPQGCLVRHGALALRPLESSRGTTTSGSPVRIHRIAEQLETQEHLLGSACNLPLSCGGAHTDTCVRLRRRLQHSTGALRGTLSGATGERVRLPASLLCVLLK